MVDRREFAGMPADLAVYVRTEYNGDHGPVLTAITHAGRVTPAVRQAGWAARAARSLGRVSEALANAFGNPGEA
jgi:hypothetical protein